MIEMKELENDTNPQQLIKERYPVPLVLHLEINDIDKLQQLDSLNIIELIQGK